jgi:F0F1-type ATP synthase assembly protein I
MGCGKQSSLWEQVGFYSSLGMIIPAAALGGFGLGWWLDRWLHTSPVFSLVLGLAGAAAGVVEVLRILIRAEKQADANNSSPGPDAS